MADVKISELNSASTLTGTELVPVVQSGTTVKTTPSAISTYINAAGAASSAVATHESSYDHTKIAHSNRTALDAVSGVNTGDQDLSGYVPTTRTVNSKALSGNITLSASDVGAAASDHTHTGVYEPANANIQSHISSTSNPHSVTATQVGLGNVTNESKATMFTNPSFTGAATVAAGTDYTTAKLRNCTLSTSDPSGGINGDIWIKYTA